MGVVERFLSAMVDHDWDAMGACVTDDVRRVGPFGDAYAGKRAYVAFIAGLLPTLADYRMDVDRVTYVEGKGLAFAELSETVALDGKAVRTPEVLVFGLTGAAEGGLIRTIDIYIQNRGTPG
jgi:SnoaL-like protein